MVIRQRRRRQRRRWRCRQPPSRRAQHRRRRRRQRSTTATTRTNESHGYKDDSGGGGTATPPPERRRLAFSSRLFSSLRPSTRLLVHGGSRRRRWSFYSFLPSLSVARSRPEQSRARAQRYCITAGQTMRESRRKRARDTGKRDDERERERVTHYHHLAYAPLGATSGRGEKERWRKKETRKEGEKAARLPLSHARTLRHFDTSDTTASSTSCTTPSSFFYRVFRDA